MKRSYIFLADGFEEIEALTTIDVMRRAGMDVVVVSIKPVREVVGAHGVTVVADATFDETQFDDVQWLVLPGGMPGAENLHNHQSLNMMLNDHAARGGKIAAICAAPAVVLAPLGLLDGKEATCYPGFEAVCRHNGAVMRDVPTVVSGNIVTGNGPAAAMRFALAIVAESEGEAAAQSVGSGMLYFPKSMNLYL